MKDNYKFWDAWPVSSSNDRETNRHGWIDMATEIELTHQKLLQQMKKSKPNFERGPYMESRKSKVTRVMRVYGLFSELSQVEKDNFINILQNHKHINNYI